MRLVVGRPTIGNSDVKLWPERAWTGLCPTPGSTVRPSRAGQRPSPGARCASWTTTWLTTAHGTPASRGADGFLVCRHGHHPQQCHRAAHATLAVHLRCAGGLTRVAAECQHAVTCTRALAAAGSTQSFSAAETADRTDLHLELHPPRAGLMQGGPVTNAPNGEGQQD